MKAQDIRKLNSKQINAKIAELKEELFNLKFQAALGNLEKPARMKDSKRDSARMKTSLTAGSDAVEETKPAKKSCRKKSAASDGTE